MENKSIRIINKSKEGATLKTGNKTQLVPWDEFKTNFVVEEDGKHCHFTDEFLAKAKVIDEKIGEAAALFLMCSAPAAMKDPVKRMSYLAAFGSSIQEISNLVGCTDQEAAMMVKKSVDTVRGFANNGFAHKETPEEYRARKARVAEEHNPHRTYEPSAKQTMGDLPGMDKLKKQFGM